MLSHIQTQAGLIALFSNIVNGYLIRQMAEIAYSRYFSLHTIHAY
jgi:hypothetical protein